MKVHPDRYGNFKSNANRLIVFHTSEGGESATAAENLAAYLSSPGDQIDPSDGSRFGASYHFITDTDRVLPAVPVIVVAYSAAGANHDGIHICFPGKAGQTRDQWLDANSTAHIRQGVQVARDVSITERIPLIRLTVNDVKAGKSGYCDHWTITKAYGRSTHTDLGAEFPWDYLAAELIKTGELPMATLADDKRKRLVDTREPPWTGKVAAGTDFTVLVPGDRPSWAGAAIVNITVTENKAAGFVTAWDGAGVRPGEAGTPLQSNVNMDAPNQIRANLAHVSLTNGSFKIYASTDCELVVDLVGYDSLI